LGRFDGQDAFIGRVEEKSEKVSKNEWEKRRKEKIEMC
jgi:hypothetical protein